MKFFGEDGLDLDETLFLRILSFVDLKTIGRSREVSRSWRDAIDRKIPFLPAIPRIPQLSAYPVSTFFFDMQSKALKGGMPIPPLN